MSAPLFDPQALKLAVERHLENVTIPEGDHAAIFTVANQDSVKIVTAVRAGDRWDVGGFVDVARKPDDSWGVEWGVTFKTSF